MNKLQFIGISFLMLIFLLSTTREETTATYKSTLSAYGFFEGNIADMQPAKDVLPYQLKSALFSDYALKARFIKLPKGTQAIYNDKEVMDFPIGTAIIKTFYYLEDFRKPTGKKNLMETRILLHEEKGWVALPYVWNEEQTDALLDVAGDTKFIAWKDEKGKKHKLDYAIPNMNQCKGCHYRKDKLMPIGPTARQLNGDFEYNDGNKNQLIAWQQKGILKTMPSLDKVPTIADWKIESSGSLEDRARAYLDINCAHCHRKEGPANTSGLFLDIHQEEPTALGINKSPIAAGRGSGDRKYSIVPGDANASIMIYRMTSKDPGVMMPEVSRKMVHKEGLALIKDWINGME